MTLNELKEKAITEALKRNNGNAEKSAWDLKVSARTVYSFKKKQEQNKVNAFLNKKNDLLTTLCEKLKPSKQ
jgi:transcriptional regulator with PAS, ATPase and Fis domain